MTSVSWGIFSSKLSGGEIPATDVRLFFYNYPPLPVYKKKIWLLTDTQQHTLPTKPVKAEQKFWTNFDFETLVCHFNASTVAAASSWQLVLNWEKKYGVELTTEE